ALLVGHPGAVSQDRRDCALVPCLGPITHCGWEQRDKSRRVFVSPQSRTLSTARAQIRRDCNLNGVTPETEETPVTDVTISESQGPVALSAADEQVLRELTERARTGGVRLTGEGGLLGTLTKMV